MENSNNKNRHSFRLQGFNYAANHATFVTICSYQRQPTFGDIRDGTVHLTAIGNFIKTEIEATPQIRNYVTIGEWVIMPNHVHLIVFIHHDEPNAAGTQRVASLPSSAIHSQLNLDPEYKNKFGPQSHNLSSVIRGIKSGVTTEARKIGYDDPVWQSRFHDHIIRNQEELIRIENYIRENPLRWNEDENNPMNF